MLRTSATLGSARSVSERARRPRSRSAAVVRSPSGTSTRTRIGRMTPTAPRSARACTPRPASVAVGHQPRAGRSMRIHMSGAVSTAIVVSPRIMARRGWRLSVRAHFSQICGEWYQASRLASHRGRSMERPNVASSAGRKVTHISTATATTTRPPIPMLRVSTSGVINSAPKPTATVVPEVMTATPAVLRVRSAASLRRSPRVSSSRKRVTTSRE